MRYLVLAIPLAALTAAPMIAAADLDQPAAAASATARTGKERLTDKASDQQRVDDCKVPPVRRTRARPTDCSYRWARAGQAADSGGYPAATRAEYVSACMATNSANEEALKHCSCAIDVIASVLPYDKYEKAETVLRMRRSAGGYLGQEFRSALTNDIVRDLEEAQAEAEVRCF